MTPMSSYPISPSPGSFIESHPMMHYRGERSKDDLKSKPERAAERGDRRVKNEPHPADHQLP
jgi:hypothetical protein